MVSFRLWSVAVIAMVLTSSLIDSKVVSTNHLNEIEQDLASILNQADTADPEIPSAALDKSVLTGFIPQESTKDTNENVPLTVQMLNEDEARSTVNELLDHLSKDVAQPSMGMPESPVKTDRFGNQKRMDIPQPPATQTNDDGDEKIPEDILRHLKSVRDEYRMGMPHAPGTIDGDEYRMDMPHAPGTIHRVSDEGRMDMPRVPAAVDRDGVRMDMPKAPKANDRACPGMACKSKKELITGILMDELVRRMKSYVKRGEKIPRKMFELWRNYRTKRHFKTPMM